MPLPLGYCAIFVPQISSVNENSWMRPPIMQHLISKIGSTTLTGYLVPVELPTSKRFHILLRDILGSQPHHTYKVEVEKSQYMRDWSG